MSSSLADVVSGGKPVVPLNAYWTPDVLAEVVTLPYLLVISYFLACGFSIGNYAGYVRFHTDVYGEETGKAYIAFVVIGTACYFLFSACMWVWAGKYSEGRSDKAQKLQWGIWAIFLLKDFPLFIIELSMIMCCGMNNGYQGFVFVIQCIFCFFSFSFTWLSFTWRAAGVFQLYYGNVSENGLKTGAERVLILGAQEPMNIEPVEDALLHESSPMSGRGSSGHWGGALRRPQGSPYDARDAVQQSSSRSGSAFGGGGHYIPYPNPNNYYEGERYSPPMSPLAKYAYSNSATRYAEDEYGMRPPPPTPSDSLPSRRNQMSSPWDRRGVAPMPALERVSPRSHLSSPASRFGGSIMVERHII